MAYLEQLDDTVVDTSATIASARRGASGPVLTGPPTEVGPGDASVLGVRVDAGAHGGIRVESVTLRVAGAGALHTRIHADVDGDGRPGPGDKLLVEAIVAPDGDPVVLPLRPARLVAAGGSGLLLVPLRNSRDGAVAGEASAGRGYRILVSDVGAVGLTSATPSARVGVPLVAWMCPGSERMRNDGCRPQGSGAQSSSAWPSGSEK